MDSCNILIVDDTIENLEIIISIIEEYHPEYNIYQADSGKTALKILDRVTPDIILTDWDMPGMSGIEFISTLQESDSKINIPAIIVTGVMLQPNDLKTAIEAGAVDYIRKPVNAVELLARMHSAITIAKHNKQLIREKENVIIENVIFTNEVNNFLVKLRSNINDIKKNAADVESTVNKMAGVLKDLDEKIKGNGWQKYTKAYNSLHPKFKKRVLSKHPDLTPNELELTEMIRLGLSTKELAGMMFISPDSMRVSRSRLRKKLMLTSDQNLQSYLYSV